MASIVAFKTNTDNRDYKQCLTLDSKLWSNFLFSFITSYVLADAIMENYNQ